MLAHQICMVAAQLNAEAGMMHCRVAQTDRLQHLCPALLYFTGHVIGMSFHWACHWYVIALFLGTKNMAALTVIMCATPGNKPTLSYVCNTRQ